MGLPCNSGFPPHKRQRKVGNAQSSQLKPKPPQSTYGVTFTSYINRPLSRGEITLASSDPLDRPIINPNYLSVPDDVRCAVAGVCWNLNILYAKAFDDIRGEEVAPGRT